MSTYLEDAAKIYRDVAERGSYYGRDGALAAWVLGSNAVTAQNWSGTSLSKSARKPGSAPIQEMALKRLGRRWPG